MLVVVVLEFAFENPQQILCSLTQFLSAYHFQVLTNEVGEDVSIPSLLGTPGSWRGRAQQILVLQGKVSCLPLFHPPRNESQFHLHYGSD